MRFTCMGILFKIQQEAWRYQNFSPIWKFFFIVPWKLGKVCLWGILYSCQTSFMFESSTEGRCQKKWNSTWCLGNVNISLSLPQGLVCPYFDSPWNLWHWDLSNINNFALCQTDSSFTLLSFFFFSSLMSIIQLKNKIITKNTQDPDLKNFKWDSFSQLSHL